MVHLGVSSDSLNQLNIIFLLSWPPWSMETASKFERKWPLVKSSHGLGIDYNEVGLLLLEIISDCHEDTVIFGGLAWWWHEDGFLCKGRWLIPTGDHLSFFGIIFDDWEGVIIGEWGIFPELGQVGVLWTFWGMLGKLGVVIGEIDGTVSWWNQIFMLNSVLFKINSESCVSTKISEICNFLNIITMNSKETL